MTLLHLYFPKTTTLVSFRFDLAMEISVLPFWGNNEYSEVAEQGRKTAMAS